VTAAVKDAASGAFDPTIAAAQLRARQGDEAWSGEEVRGLHEALVADMERLAQELALGEAKLRDLVRDPGGAGDDQADTGSRALEREQALTLVNNVQDMIIHTKAALEKLESGQYGLCASCDGPIGKARLIAFPRALLCVACKQREERR
jgi:DnaK suppressor protein